eukprot:CAMPEP_0202076482 /NCGR_PEP_ID=MMETSP0964-20121228/4835_1 /ASSEMBLY_ACC=CAM_ASM_000500 /TAXON_ID=4773 /ORGANISM="Schizochytrium aggregatum, Strain ATCC28209" /LENGTH=145 /DNA_ID=CAMNT_0048643727 /DNA_START=346 /DNA_END=781 /DNA_ORIENTATION=-
MATVTRAALLRRHVATSRPRRESKLGPLPSLERIEDARGDTEASHCRGDRSAAGLDGTVAHAHAEAGAETQAQQVAHARVVLGDEPAGNGKARAEGCACDEAGNRAALGVAMAPPAVISAASPSDVCASPVTPISAAGAGAAGSC